MKDHGRTARWQHGSASRHEPAFRWPAASPAWSPGTRSRACAVSVIPHVTPGPSMADDFPSVCAASQAGTDNPGTDNIVVRAVEGHHG